MPLETRPYGPTGEKVSVIGLGGAGLCNHSFAEGVATVHRALALGVTYFDTAPHYAGGMSQPILGDALTDRPERYLLAAKIGMLTSTPRFRSYDALRAQLDENLRLLRRDSVDTLQVHDVTHIDGGQTHRRRRVAPQSTLTTTLWVRRQCRCYGMPIRRAFAGSPASQAVGSRAWLAF